MSAIRPESTLGNVDFVWPQGTVGAEEQRTFFYMYIHIPNN